MNKTFGGNSDKLHSYVLNMNYACEGPNLPYVFCMDYRSRFEKEVTGVRVCGMCIQSCPVGQGIGQDNRITKTGVRDCLTTHLAVLPIRTSAMTPRP